MKTKAVVIIELQIEVDDTWSADTTVDQVRKQSKVSAMQVLNKMLKGTVGVNLIGDFNSTIIMLEE